MKISSGVCSKVVVLMLFLLVGLAASAEISWAQEPGTIITVAGNGTRGFSGDGGAATQASLDYPRGVFVDTLGNIYFADRDNHRIRKVDPNGTITTIAGNGIADFSGDGGLATQASLNQVHWVSGDEAGNLYIADYANHRIRKVDTNGIITTIFEWHPIKAHAADF